MTDTLDTSTTESGDDRPGEAAVSSAAAAELNNLIGGDPEIVALESGKAVSSDEAPTKLDAAYVEKTLKSHYEHWEEGAGEAHRRLYRLLGWIFEWGPELDRDSRLEIDIRARIEERHKVKVRPGTTGDELLLMLTVGFGKIANVTRCQWNKALRAAQQEGVARNASQLAEWLEENCGVKTAGALYRPGEEGRAAAFNFSDYLDSLIEGENRRAVDLRPTGLALPEGDQILIARSGRQEGEVEILGAVHDPKTVEFVAKRHKAEAAKIEKLLWDANRYAMRAAGHGLAGKMAPNDPMAFANAMNALIDDPWSRKQFFEDDVVPLEIPKETLASDRFQIMSPAFNVYDPGRYVKGAREGALLPYAPDRTVWGKLTLLEQLESASRSYLNHHLKSKVPEPSNSEIRRLIASERKRLADEKQAESDRKSAKQLEDV